MNAGIPVSRCSTCGKGYFPARLGCPSCGGTSWRDDRVLCGRIEEVTVIEHAVGRTDWTPRHIASVRTEDGQLIVAGLESAMYEGALVELFESDGALWALPPHRIF